MMIPSDGFGTVKTERSHRVPTENVKKWPHKQNIALFLHSSTMTVAPCLHLNFRTKGMDNV